MRRRLVLPGLAALAVASRSALGQEAGRTYRIAVVSYAARGAFTEATLGGLQAMGFVEGRNLVMERRGLGLREDQLVDAVRKVIGEGTDVLLAGGGPFIKAAKAATGTVPIVGITDDMVGEGHVSSLARPGGNVTGVSILATELDGKRQEILMEALPRARKIAVLADPSPQATTHFAALQKARPPGAIELLLVRAGNAAAIEAALRQAKEQGADAVNVLASPTLFAYRQALFDAATALRLPTMFQWPEGASEGALLAYGPVYADAFRLWGVMTGRVLRGAKPRDLPIEQPTTFKLAVNIKLARAFGITLPSALLQRADEVIE